MFQPYSKTVCPILPSRRILFLPHTGLNGFLEPTNLVTQVARPAVEKSLAELNELVLLGSEDKELIRKCEEQRIQRAQDLDEAAQELVRVYGVWMISSLCSSVDRPCSGHRPF